jgi:hypothetical protein
MYISILTPLDGSKTAEWKLLLEQPGKIDNFSFPLSTDWQDCHGSVLRSSQLLASSACSFYNDESKNES